MREITGLPLSPHYGASKLRWYLDHVPAVQRAAMTGDLACGPLSSFLVSRLTEERRCLVDPANASRTLLYDPSQLQWSPELLRLFDLDPRHLPACVPTRCAFGRIVLGAQRVPLTACTGDQSAAAFAFGRPEPDCALVNVGTGAFIQRVASPAIPLPDGILRSVLCADDEGAVLSHEGTVNGAGSALDWLRERVAIDVDRALAALGTQQSFAAATAAVHERRRRPRRAVLAVRLPVRVRRHGDDDARLAAVIESIAFLLCVNLEALHRAAPLRRIRISGGLARNDYLCRCLASLSGLRVERPLLVEATARGVAFLAAGKPASWRNVEDRADVRAGGVGSARVALRPVAQRNGRRGASA